jgi:hypothetical protein
MRVALIAAVLACTALAATARADVTWTGNTDVNNDGVWSDDNNWDSLAPEAGDTAIIPQSPAMAVPGTSSAT